MSLTDEESNFLRFYFLSLKIASKAVRVYFDSVHPPAGLGAELTKSSVTLKGLRFMTKLQLSILYPSPAKTVTSAEFDTTLIICLLRNMPPRESAPLTGWDKLPLPGDTSTGADLARIKWYRNQLVHSNDGVLSSTDFSQFWGDLEGAIGRLGGPSMYTEAQSAQHVVLDASLTDMLLQLKNCEKTLDEQTNKIDNHQAAIDSQKTKNVDLENKIQQMEAETQKQTTKLSDYKDSVDACKKENETCKKDIIHNKDIIKELQDQSVTKQNEIVNLIIQIGKHESNYEQHDKMLKEHEEHLTKQDEQIDTNVKSIDAIKQKLHGTNYTSVRGKQKKLEDDTTALVENDISEGTFVTTMAVTDGLLLLKQNGVLLITGYAGTGKSRIGRHVLHMFCTDSTAYKCIKLNTLEEWEDMVNREEKVVVLIDDIFGETNCIYNREKAIPILDKVHAYVRKGNINVIITIRDTVKRQCQDVFETHRLFEFDSIDLSSDKYVLKWDEKQNILAKYMEKVRQSAYTDNEGFVDCNGDSILDKTEVLKIVQENPVKGFPFVVYQFVHNNKYFFLGSKFFDRPTEAILEEMNAIRRKGEYHKKFMIQYAVMVYTAINENCINPDDSSKLTEIAKVIDAIYGVTTKLKKCNILDAVKELKGSYLINIPNQRSYRLHHPTLQESVILSFAQIDEENIEKIIPLISWSFLEKMVKPDSYKEKEGEVVLRIPNNSYKLLAKRLVDIYIEELRMHGYFLDTFFSHNLSKTVIFQQAYWHLLPSLIEALEEESNIDKHTENMIRSAEINRFRSHLVHLENKDTFLPNLLDTLAKSESQLDIFNFVLKMLKTKIKSSSYHLAIDYMKSALISSLYAICATKDVRCVKATLEIVEENKIPVLLDQGIILNDIPDLTSTSTFLKECDNETCVFLTVCIWKAYEVFNIPVLELLFSKYNQTPFDITLFLKMIYCDTWIEKMILFGREGVLDWQSLCFEPLKWMIEKFKDQELDNAYFILKTACQYQMLNTVEYVASKFKTFDNISCLLAFVDKPKSLACKIPFNRELFNFLLKKIDISSNELVPVVMSVIQRRDVPDYMFDAFLPVCLNSSNILTLAYENGQFYLVKLIIESSDIEHLDIQAALIAVCQEYDKHHEKANDEVEKLKIVKYLAEKNEFEQFDLKSVCQTACSSKYFKIMDWFVHNIDSSRLDVYTIINSALVSERSDILNHIMTNTELESLDKRKVLKSVAKHYTVECSTKILQIVSTIWNNKENKEELNMEEIVNIAYESKSFELLMWIHENCHLHVSIDARRLLMSACEDCRVDVTKWVLQTFEQTTLDIDGGELYLLSCGKKLNPSNDMIYDHWIGMVSWIPATFQIKRLDIISGLLKLVRVDQNFRNQLSYLVVSLLEKYVSRLNTEDLDAMKEMIDTSLKQKYYIIVNWFLENENCCSFDKQEILNNACTDAEIETIKILSKYFSCLDMHQAMNCILSTKPLYYYSFNQHDQEPKCLNDHPTVACLELLWKEIDQDCIDMKSILSTVCHEEEISSNAMTWILLNLPINRIPINVVLITCCQQSKINLVKYIFHEVDNEQLEVEEAFLQTCLASDPECKWIFGESLCVIDFLFQKLQDKTSSLTVIIKELLCKNNFDLILYFLQAGYYRNIDMTELINLACRDGNIRLVQWILANVEHKELDIKSAFLVACDSIHSRRQNRDQKQLQCVAIMWHYIQDINMFEIETVLKSTTESKSNTSDSNLKNGLKTWLLYIMKICQSDNTLLNTADTTNQQSQQVNDEQCCLEDLQDNDGLKSSNHDDDDDDSITNEKITVGK